MKTIIGTFSIHQILPELFDGYTGSEADGYIAIPEKALFDTVYLRSPRGKRIYLPELALPDGFDEAKLHEWTSRISHPRLKTLLDRGLDDALSKTSTPAA